MAFVGIKGFMDGKPAYLVSYFDSNDPPRACGFGDATDYPYLYFVNPVSETDMA